MTSWQQWEIRGSLRRETTVPAGAIGTRKESRTNEGGTAVLQGHADTAQCVRRSGHGQIKRIVQSVRTVAAVKSQVA